jgi:uncharacterized protein
MTFGTVVKRYPLIAFCVLAYTLSWWAWPLYAMDLIPIPVAPFGPFLAALVVLAITGGKRGVSGLLRRMVQWRVGFRWYVLALLIPVGLTGIAAALNLLLGATPDPSVSLDSWPSLFATFAVVLLVPGLGGAWEEPGWRGFAVPRLQTGRSALLAGLILAVIIVGWHIPLMVVGQVHWSDIVLIFGAVIVFNAVFNSVGGSVLIIMVMHAANNTVSGSFFSPMFTGADSIRQSWLLAGVWCATAIAVIVWAGPTHLSRRHRRQQLADIAPEAPAPSVPVVAPPV